MSAWTSGGVSPASLETLGLQVVDLATYVVVLVAFAFVPLAVVEVFVFGGVVFTKWILFFVGVALAAYASLRMRPASPKRRAAAVAAGPNEATVGSVRVSFVQRVAASVPPASWTGLAVDERFSPNVKRFVGAVALVVVAMLLEFAFGVGFAV